MDRKILQKTLVRRIVYSPPITVNQKLITECGFFSARRGGFELDLFQYDNDDTDDDTLVRNSIRIESIFCVFYHVINVL